MAGTLRVFVAGAAGAVGRQLVPMLVAAGHDVSGTTRSRERAAWLAEAGAQPVVVDAYDAPALTRAVEAARPDVVIHQLTDLARGFAPDDLRRNGRLREVGTRNVVRAAVAAGARRVVAQSAAWLYAPGPEPRQEDDPLRPLMPDEIVLPGVLELERLVLGTPELEGVVLRYGFLYGPGTGYDGPGDAPTVHVAAAARAAALAATAGSPGVYNIVDDGQWVSNVKAGRVLGWHPDARVAHPLAVAG